MNDLLNEQSQREPSAGPMEVQSLENWTGLRVSLSSYSLRQEDRHMRGKETEALGERVMAILGSLFLICLSFPPVLNIASGIL